MDLETPFAGWLQPVRRRRFGHHRCRDPRLWWAVWRPASRPRDEAGHLLRHLRRSSSGWAIACPNLLPRDLGGVDFSQRWGFGPGRKSPVNTTVPASSLRTEDVIGSLAGSTRPSSKEGPRCFRATFLPRRFPAPIPSRRRPAAARQPVHIRHLPSRPIRTR